LNICDDDSISNKLESTFNDIANINLRLLLFLLLSDSSDLNLLLLLSSGLLALLFLLTTLGESWVIREGFLVHGDDGFEVFHLSND